MQIWVRKKAQGLKMGFKYSFWLRAILEIHLEVCILSMMNLKQPAGLSKPMQIVSLLVSVIFIVLNILFFAWATDFGSGIYGNHRQNENTDISLVESMFGSYKFSYAPQ